MARPSIGCEEAFHHLFDLHTVLEDSSECWIESSIRKTPPQGPSEAFQNFRFCCFVFRIADQPLAVQGLERRETGFNSVR